MTDLRQAAQQALHELEGIPFYRKYGVRISTAITALKAALEQQAEPSQWRDMVVVSLVREGVNKHKARELADHFAAQQQAEPVAYFDFQELKFSWAKHMKISPVPVSVKVEPMKLYSESTKRQWQGLTDEEIHRTTVLLGFNPEWKTEIGMAHAIVRNLEAKLKERNT
jgi:hypothetical protein